MMSWSYPFKSKEHATCFLIADASLIIFDSTASMSLCFGLGWKTADYKGFWGLSEDYD